LDLEGRVGRKEEGTDGWMRRAEREAKICFWSVGASIFSAGVKN